MDDTLYGTRNKRGDWAPAKLLTYPPLFVWPMRPVAFIKWVFGYPGYLAPWNLLYALIGTLLWLYATPSLQTTQHFAGGWIAFLFLRNAALVGAFYGYFHWRLYIRKKQNTSFKFNGRWPSVDNNAFLFKSQNIDNLIWTLGSGVPIWTAFEAVTLWLFSNHVIHYVSFQSHPIYCAIIMLLIPVWRDVHFYCVHRLIHSPILYRYVHKLHHNNVNPGPWSGLAMHPVEHLLYFSAVVIHWIVPSNQIHTTFHLVHLGLAPAPSHAGFDRIIFNDEHALETHGYDHYLHHKFHECNYSDGIIPIDQWFGTFHDGSTEAQERMNKRFMDRAAKQQAKKKDTRQAV